MVDRAPTHEELSIWETLCWAALSHGQQVQNTPEHRRSPSADRLLAARKACRNVRLPVGQQMRDAPMVRLLKLIDRWATLGPDDRRQSAAELRALATEAAKLAGLME